MTPLVGGVAQAPRVFNSAATTETVTGLTNGTTFTFKVAARTIFTSGLASKASLPIVVGAPGVPTAVTATAGVGLATVHWTAPATNNGAAITGYVVTPFDRWRGSAAADVPLDRHDPDDQRPHPRSHIRVPRCRDQQPRYRIESAPSNAVTVT